MVTVLCFMESSFIAASLILVMASEVDRAGIPPNRLGGSVFIDIRLKLLAYCFRNYSADGTSDSNLPVLEFFLLGNWNDLCLCESCWPFSL